MWTRHKNHMVWTDPWVYVALPNQEIEYFQMHEPKDEPSGGSAGSAACGAC